MLIQDCRKNAFYWLWSEAFSLDTVYFDGASVTIVFYFRFYCYVNAISLVPPEFAVLAVLSSCIH
jgi:hypothetical protein